MEHKPHDDSSHNSNNNLLNTLKAINFSEVQEQEFIPIYKRSSVTDTFHDAYGIRTEYQFITKGQMKNIQKSKGR